MARKRTPVRKRKTTRSSAKAANASDLPAEGPQAPGPDAEVSPEAEPREGFPVVGIGASAGGLAAFEAFFSAMPADTESGMAIVLVQHLAPDHKSILSDLVKRYTSMQVYEVEDGMAVQPKCAYIIPPNRDMAFLNGTLQLLEPTAPRGMRLPIDFFFRSLAQDQGERAICVVLSGTGSDGTLGVRAVKGEGGMVMAQAPDTTQYDGMPRSAIATGLVDYVLAPAEMPAQLVAYVSHAFGRRSRRASPPAPSASDTLSKICVLLRSQTGHDFSQYKETTLVRRVERRMAVHQIERPGDYLRYMQRTPSEVEALFRELLIGVTRFFRDPEAFEVLRTQALPRLLAGKAPGAPVRVWVCGCSTGEEAYSIAMLIHEHIQNLGQAYKVQVFATDVDSRAIEQARHGIFPASIAADVTDERLARFFVQGPDNDVYQVQKVIRDMLVFSEQDVIKDPPFSKLDLISCRNLLIYMNGELQRKLIPLFHYALNPEGVLYLGTSETVGEFTSLFEPLDRKAKLYMRKRDIPGAPRLGLGQFVPSLAPATLHARPPGAAAPAERGTDLRGLTEQSLLRHYAQAAVLVTGRGEILHIYGRTGKYLEPAPGDAAVNILPMAREGLHRELATALHKAVVRREAVRYHGLRVRTNGETATVDLTVEPVASSPGDGGGPELFLVILEEPPPSAPDAAAAGQEAGTTPTDADGRIAEMEQELRAKDEYLQTTLEEMETSNEELKSTNEEMQSVNEELQSTNEELETSKEELQSLNEELATVNAELQDKVLDLSRANNDMNNLLAGTGVGTLFVDHALRITRFTPDATQVINLIQADIGRPVGHIVPNLMGYDALIEDVQAVLEDLMPREREVQTKEGQWYLMRIRAYRTVANVIEGAVLTFVDITERRRQAAALQTAEAFSRAIVATVREPLVVLGEDLRVVMANRAFYRSFGVTEEETAGRLLYELGNSQWDIPDLRRLLEEILPEDNCFEGFEVTHEFERIGQRTMLLNARRVLREADEPALILLAIEDVAKPDS